MLTGAQVFALAELVGRRPIGNIRQGPTGGYRMRFRRHGEMRTSPETYTTRAEAERALWQMADDGRADCTHDRRYRALVLLATFASLRWGEATALRRADIDLSAGPPDYDESSARRDHQASAAVIAFSASLMPSPTSPAVAAQCKGIRARAPGSQRCSSRVSGSGAVPS